jgi:hypothetical protein
VDTSTSEAKLEDHVKIRYMLVPSPVGWKKHYPSPRQLMLHLRRHGTDGQLASQENFLYCLDKSDFAVLLLDSVLKNTRVTPGPLQSESPFSPFERNVIIVTKSSTALLHKPLISFPSHLKPVIISFERARTGTESDWLNLHLRVMMKKSSSR